MKTNKNNSSNFWNKLDKGAEWAQKGGVLDGTDKA